MKIYISIFAFWVGRHPKRYNINSVQHWIPYVYETTVRNPDQRVFSSKSGITKTVRSTEHHTLMKRSENTLWNPVPHPHNQLIPPAPEAH